MCYPSALTRHRWPLLVLSAAFAATASDEEASTPLTGAIHGPASITRSETGPGGF